MKRTRLHLLWRDAAARKRFRTGVSLHSHTLHSEESLAFVPRYTAGLPVIGCAIRHQEKRHLALTGRPLDFSRAFWRPPLAPREAYELERRQLEEDLDVEALISLSDHDDIQAGSVLRVLLADLPISVEWTVPFGPSFFHLGVHNLPPRNAPEVMSRLAACTSAVCRQQTAEMLAALHELPETLIVMNHPMWDEARIGAVEHAQLVGRFLERFGEHIHALELNGLRPWKENCRVMWLAEHSGHVLISGGDRHGLEPNSNVNLTNARTFAEFVSEIRNDGISDVAFMPQSREPFRVRMIQTMCDIVRDYPHLPIGRRRWSDRVFYRQPDGTAKPLSAFWNGGDEPWPVKVFVYGVRAARSQQVRSALRMALPDAQEVSV